MGQPRTKTFLTAKEVGKSVYKMMCQVLGRSAGSQIL